MACPGRVYTKASPRSRNIPDASASNTFMRVRLFVVCLSLLILAASAATKKPPTAKRPPAKAAPPQGEDWLLWGGKNRDFHVNAGKLADSWPAEGPRKIWSRPLGDGYSAVAVEQ